MIDPTGRFRGADPLDEAGHEAGDPAGRGQRDDAARDTMADSELAALLAQHESRAIGYYTSEIAAEQAESIDHYYGRPFGDERDGRSRVVDRTVAVTIDNALAALLKPFVSAEDVVSFEPRQPEDEQAALQASEYINYVFQVDNPGFTILHHWFKDALLTKIGIVKYWWEDRTRNTVETLRVDDVGLLDARARPDYLHERDLGDGSHVVTAQRRTPDGRVRIENVPPEEFLISPLARSIEDAPYVAHRPTNMTRSDLIEMGFDADVVDGLAAGGAGPGEEVRSQARYADEEWTSADRGNPGNDRSRDIMAVRDEYVRVDQDGDGVSELRHVIRVGNVILFNEEAEDLPFALLCPVPMPHKVYGLSLADQTRDLQRIASVIWRQMLDNLYLSNNPRPVIPDGAVNENTYEDLEEDAPGAAIRVRSPGMLDWSVVPFAADRSYPMLSFIGEQVEARTGVRRGGNGLDRSSLNKGAQMTALQAAQIEAKENERIEMIARIFAETGVTRLFRGLLGLVSRYQPKARIIRLRNRWIPIDPRGWPDMDVRIAVGLGIGNKNDQIAQADAVLQTMMALQNTVYSGLQTPGNVHNAVKRKYQAAGIKNTDDFVTDPGEADMRRPDAPSPPDPALAKIQAEMLADRARIALDQEKAAAALQQLREANALKLQLMRDEAAARLELLREEAAAKIALQRERNDQEAALAIRLQDAEFALSQRRMDRASGTMAAEAVDPAGAEALDALMRGPDGGDPGGDLSDDLREDRGGESGVMHGPGMMVLDEPGRDPGLDHGDWRIHPNRPGGALDK